MVTLIVSWPFSGTSAAKLVVGLLCGSVVATPNHAEEWNIDQWPVLLADDFDADDHADLWQVYWGPRPSRRVDARDFVSPQSVRGHVLSLTGHEGLHESHGRCEQVYGDGVESSSFVAKVYLPDDFSMGTCRQLKLFAMRAGKTLDECYGGAGKQVSGDRASAVLAIDRQRRPHLYVYHMNQKDRWGDHFTFETAQPLALGRWVPLEFRWKLNNVDRANGRLAMYVDGRELGRVSKLRFRNAPECRIRRWAIDFYYGGALMTDVPPKTQSAYVDDVRIRGL